MGRWAISAPFGRLAYNITASNDLGKEGPMFRQPFGRHLGRVQVGRIPPALKRANQMMASGHYAEAAGILRRDQFQRLYQAGMRFVAELNGQSNR